VLGIEGTEGSHSAKPGYDLCTGVGVVKGYGRRGKP
jgi:hypothetical protein